MILADTNIIIDFWKYPLPEKRETIGDRQTFLSKDKICLSLLFIAIW